MHEENCEENNQIILHSVNGEVHYYYWKVVITSKIEHYYWKVWTNSKTSLLCICDASERQI